MTTASYEITFKGEASQRLRTVFDDLDVTTTHGVTVLRGGLPDQAALLGVIHRLEALGLELVDVRVVVDE